MVNQFQLSVKGLRQSVANWIVGQDDHSDAFLQRLVDTGRDIDQLSFDVIGLTVLSVASYACGKLFLQIRPNISVLNML